MIYDIRVHSEKLHGQREYRERGFLYIGFSFFKGRPTGQKNLLSVIIFRVERVYLYLKDVRETSKRRRPREYIVIRFLS